MNWHRFALYRKSIFKDTKPHCLSDVGAWNKTVDKSRLFRGSVSYSFHGLALAHKTEEFFASWWSCGVHVAFLSLPPPYIRLIQSNEWYDKGVGTIHEVDKQCYLAAHMGVLPICMWWCGERKHHLGQKPSAPLFVCLVLHSEAAGDSPVAFGSWFTANRVRLHQYVTPAMCHPVIVMVSTCHTASIQWRTGTKSNEWLQVYIIMKQ